MKSMMMRCVVIAVLIGTAFPGHAATPYATPDSAIKSVLGERSPHYMYLKSTPTLQAPEGTIAGIVFDKADDPSIEKLGYQSTAKVFILDRVTLKDHWIVETSRWFAFEHGPRRYVETVQADGPGRFHLQINNEGNCGIGREIFRFAKLKGVWRVTGLDLSVPAEPNSSEGSTKGAQECDVNYDARRRSVNFLTGVVVDATLKRGVIIKEVRRKNSRQDLLLSKFELDVLSDTYLIEGGRP